MIEPEFSRPVRADRITQGEHVAIVATAEECARLAARMGIEAVHSLECRFTFSPAAGSVVTARLDLTSRISQICVVTLEPFESPLLEAATVRFVPQGTEGDDEDPEAPDEVPYEGITIDLGEAAAEQLALALDPYPRSPGAVLPEIDAAPEHPFAALRRLNRDQAGG